jgi:hypothetical protein
MDRRIWRKLNYSKHKKRMIDEGAGSESSQVSMRYAKMPIAAKSSWRRFKNFKSYTLKHKTQPAQGPPPHQGPLKDLPIRSNKSVDKR